MPKPRLDPREGDIRTPPRQRAPSFSHGRGRYWKETGLSQRRCGIRETLDACTESRVRAEVRKWSDPPPNRGKRMKNSAASSRKPTLTASGSVQFKTVHKARRYHQVAEQIQRLIAQGVLRPGDRLPAERDLAAQLGV